MIFGNREGAVGCGGENLGGTKGCVGGDFGISLASAGLGAKGRGSVFEELSYRLLGAGVGVGGGPRSSPFKRFLSASFAALVSSGRLPCSVNRKYWFLTMV